MITAPHLAFTITHEKSKFNRIITDIHIVLEDKTEVIKGLWDTGASHSAICKSIAEKLELKPKGAFQISTAGGVIDSHQYKISLGLPNKFLVKDVLVGGIDLQKQDIKMLVGMDIIMLGNFAISHTKEGKMFFSFCMPPFGEHIDYVKRIEDKKVAERKSGSNRYKKRK